MAKRVLLVLVGSLGDVLPFLALAEALRLVGRANPEDAKSGAWEVTIAAHPEYETRVREELGFAYAPIKPSIVHALRDTPEGVAVRTAGVFSAFRAARDFFGPLLKSWANDIRDAHTTHRPDLVILTTFPAMCGLGSIGSTPYMIAHTVPAQPTRLFAPPTAGSGFTLPFEWLNSLMWNMGESAMTNLMPVVDPQHPKPVQEARDKQVPTLYIYSPTLCPKPVDWPAYSHVVGQLTFESARLAALRAQAGAEKVPNGTLTFAPSEALAKLLAAAAESTGGPDPAHPLIYIGFGSMLGTVFSAAEATTLLRHCAEAVADLLAGGVKAFAIIHTSGLPEGSAAPALEGRLADRAVVTAEYIPHAHLFPRCHLIVHHGGAGTSHAAVTYSLRPQAGDATANASDAAAILTLPCSKTSDQPFWADILHRAGTGPAPLEARGASRSALLSRFRDAVSGGSAERMRRATRDLALRLRAEDGVAGSLSVIDAYAVQLGLPAAKSAAA